MERDFNTLKGIITEKGIDPAHPTAAESHSPEWNDYALAKGLFRKNTDNLDAVKASLEMMVKFSKRKNEFVELTMPQKASLFSPRAGVRSSDTNIQRLRLGMEWGGLEAERIAARVENAAETAANRERRGSFVARAYNAEELDDISDNMSVAGINIR